MQRANETPSVSSDVCVYCLSEVPEGRMICAACEASLSRPENSTDTEDYMEKLLKITAQENTENCSKAE